MGLKTAKTRRVKMLVDSRDENVHQAERLQSRSRQTKAASRPAGLVGGGLAGRGTWRGTE